MESCIFGPKSSLIVGGADKSFRTNASALLPKQTCMCEHTDPLQCYLLLASKLTDTALDLYNGADMEALQIDFAFRRDAYMLVILLRRFLVQRDDPVVADGGVDARRNKRPVLLTKYLYRKATAVIQGHSDPVGVEIEGNNHTDEANPLNGMVDEEVYVLT